MTPGTSQKVMHQQAAWLLQFAERDLTQHPKHYPGLGLEAGRLFGRWGRPFTWGELRDLQRRLRDGLEALREGRDWEYESRVKSFVVPGRQGLAGPLIGRIQTRWPWDTFILRAMDVLVDVGDRLRTCAREGCKRAFIAVKRQLHCRECAKALQKARVSAWRKRHAQRVRDLAHEAYVRRKRRETGRRNLKIARRPRKGRERSTL